MLDKKKLSSLSGARPGSRKAEKDTVVSGLGSSSLGAAAEQLKGGDGFSNRPTGGLFGKLNQVADKFKDGELDKNKAGNEFIKRKFGVDALSLIENPVDRKSKFDNLNPKELGNSKILDDFLR